MKALELFSGIGGWHHAALSLRNSEPAVEVEVVSAYDINDTANRIYRDNFGIKPSARPIDRLTLAEIEGKDCDVWLASPPCQPYTSQGKQLGNKDRRSSALLHLCEVLQSMKRPPKFIAMENVVPFYGSDSHSSLLNALGKAGYGRIDEFFLSPTQFGIPNERPRYYLAAKLGSGPGPKAPMSCIPNIDMADAPKSPDASKKRRRINNDKNDGEISIMGPYVDLNAKRAPLYQHCATISSFLDKDVNEGLYLSKNQLLKHPPWMWDMVSPSSRFCSCFTSNYGRYLKGTGSLISHGLYNKECVELLPRLCSLEDCDRSQMSAFQLRYFSPREMLRLMGFPDVFKTNASDSDRDNSSEDNSTRKNFQIYKLVGNSVNVTVCSAVLKYLLQMQAHDSQQ